MIPENIDKSDVLAAIRRIDAEGVPAPRKSKVYNLLFNGRSYPPKYVLSLANESANGKELPWRRFRGGAETNTFLHALGFTIVAVD